MRPKLPYWRQRLYEIEEGYAKRINLNPTVGRRSRESDPEWDEKIDGDYPRLQDKERRQREAKAKPKERIQRTGSHLDRGAPNVGADPEEM